MLSRGLRRWLIVAASLVLLLCAYTAFGFFGVPRLLRSNLDEFVSTHYQRHLSVGEIRFNPFTLALEVRSLSLPDSDGKPMLGFDRLFVNVGTVSIWRRAPSFQEISLENPFARVLIRPDGTLNLTDLAKGFPPEAPAKKPASDEPMRLFIERLSVRGGRTVFEDRSRPEPFSAQLTPISFELRDFSTTGKTGNTYSLAGASELGERFKWNGTLDVTPVSSRGHFEVDNLQAHTLWSYARDSLGFEIPSGAIALAGDYEFTTAGTPIGLTVDVHDVTVTNLGLRARGKDANYIDLARIEVRDTKLDLAKRSVEVGKVRLAGGEVKAWREPAGAINLMELAGHPGTAAAKSAPAIAPVEPAANTGAPAPSSTATTAGADATAPATAGAAAPAQGGATSTSPPPPSSQSAWTVAVPDIAVDGFKISAEDRQITPTVAVTLDPLNIHVTGFTTAPGAQLKVEADTGINGRAKLQAMAKVSPDSGAVSAHTDLKGLDLTFIQPYLTQQTSMTLLSGQLGTTLDIERSANGALTIKGETEVAKLRTVDNALQKDFIKWDLVRATGIEFQSQPARLRIARVDARGPYARVIIQQNQTTNISEVLTPAGTHAAAAGNNAASPTPTAADSASSDAPADSIVAHSTSPAAAPTSAAAPARSKSKRTKASRASSEKSAVAATTPPSAGGSMAMSIGTVQITNGSAHFADYSIQPNYAVAIQTLNGSVTGLSSDPTSRAKLKLEGKVDRYAPVHINGEMNLLSATAYSDIKLDFKGVELSSVTPYSGRFAGYKIEKGKLSAELSYHVDQRKLTAAHHIVIDQLQLGEKVDSPDAVKLPLKLAIALLKDRNGVIDLGLPVTGSLDDPQFRLAPIIWKVFVNLIVKAATAPFALLGHLFGGGEEMNQVDFKPGSAELDDAGRQRMASLLKAMQERPALELDVPMAFSKDLDRPAIASRELQDKLLALKQKELGARKSAKAAPVDASVLADPAEHFRLLAAQFRQESGKDTALPDSAAAVEAAKKKKGEQPPLEPAIADLQSALIAKGQVDDSELEELGKKRAHAIQEVLLGNNEIDPGRVFLINAPPKADAKDVVRLELALK